MSYQYSYEELWQPKNFLVTFRLYQLNLDGETERVYRKYWEQSEVHFVEDREEEIETVKKSSPVLSDPAKSSLDVHRKYRKIMEDPEEVCYNF